MGAKIQTNVGTSSHIIRELLDNVDHAILSHRKKKYYNSIQILLGICRISSAR